MMGHEFRKLETVHVWTARLNNIPEAAPGFAAIATPEEKERAARIRPANVRRRYVAARIFLRTTLSLYAAVEPRQIAWIEGPHGKPHVDVPGLEFNLTHSEDLALLAVARGRSVGIDVERIKPEPMALDIAARFFSCGEHEALGALSPVLVSDAFYAVWTRKEAFLKGLGLGIPRHLGQFTVTTPPGAAALVEVDWSPELAGQWSLVDLKTDEGYRACLAVEGPSLPVRRLEWSLDRWHRWRGRDPWRAARSAAA